MVVVEIVTGRVWRLPTLVSFHLEAGLIVPVTGVDKLCIFREMTELQRLIVAAVANLEITAVIHKVGVRLELLA